MSNRLVRDGKFWECERVKKSLVVRTGAIGTPGKETKKAYRTLAELGAAEQKAHAAKIKQGWSSADLAIVPAAREPTLEAAIRANRDDGDSYDVYADWLQAHGNALGELVALQRRSKAKLADDKIKDMALPADLMTAGWKWGMWDWLRLENDRDWNDDKFNAQNLATFAFNHTACAALRELRIGILRWSENHVDVPAVLDEAAKHAWAKDLERLVLGDVDGNIDMAHHVVGVVGDKISRTFPALTQLKIHSSEQTWHKAPSFGLAKLDLPKLTRLTIETCSMSKRRLKEVLAARLPKLTQLEIWFGDKDYGADATVDDLAPLLEGKVLATATDIGLRNFRNEALARALPGSRLAKRVKRLDLSMGTLDDESARVLVANATKFTSLEELDVSDNYVSAAVEKELKKAFRSVVSNDQRTLDDDDGANRYVSVHE